MFATLGCITNASIQHTHVVICHPIGAANRFDNFRAHHVARLRWFSWPGLARSIMELLQKFAPLGCIANSSSQHTYVGVCGPIRATNRFKNFSACHVARLKWYGGGVW